MNSVDTILGIICTEAAEERLDGELEEAELKRRFPPQARTDASPSNEGNPVPLGPEQEAQELG